MLVRDFLRNGEATRVRLLTDKIDASRVYRPHKKILESCFGCFAFPGLDPVGYQLPPMINRENEEFHPFEYPSRQAPEKLKASSIRCHR